MAKTCAQCATSKSDGSYRNDGRFKDNLSPLCRDCEKKDMAASDELLRVFAVWSSGYVSGLPDSSFAYVEAGMEKDADGKTTPRAARHFPYKDADGNLDAPHIRNALSRVEQWKKLSDGTEVSDGLRAKVRAKLQAALDSISNDNADRSMADDGELETATLETVTLERVPILSEGGPYYGTGSPAEGDYYKKADLEAIAEANRALALEIKAANKIGHSKAQKLLANSGLSLDEEPAAGWLPGETFTVEKADDGKWKLFSDIVKVPAKLAQLFKAGAFRTRSVELSRVTSQEQDGKVYEQVVTGLAWLGAKAPAVRTLDDIFALYARDQRQPAAPQRVVELLYADAGDLPSGVVKTVEYQATAEVIWEPETGFQNILADLNAALNPQRDTWGGGNRYWVQDVSTDLTHCIVNDWSANATWIVPFKMEQGEPVPAPATEWELAEQAWVKAADGYAEKNFARAGDDHGTAADTDSRMPELVKNLSELNDEGIVALAKTFGIDGDDAATLRPLVAAHLKEFSVEDVPADGDTPPAPAPAAPAAADDEQTRKMAQLESDAKLGRQAFEDRRVEKREKLMSDALGQHGERARIEPAKLDAWRKFYDESPALCEEQIKLLPPLPTTVVYGSDEALPTGVTPEQVKEQGEDAWKSYAAATGVTV